MRRHAKASTAQSKAARSGRPKHLALAVFAAFAFALVASGAAVALQTHVKGTDIDGSGTPNGFVSLAGLAVDQSGGDLYAVDTAGAADFSGALDRFDSAGVLQNQISAAFNNPQDVAVDSSGGSSDGNVYLTDSANNLIYAFDSAGAPVSSFDSDGALDGSAVPALLNPDQAFSFPCGLAVDQSTGNLYVADSGHGRIWIFDSEGAYVDRIGDSALQGPCGLAFDSTGDLYVRNSYAANVVKLDKVGATDFNYTGTVLDSNNASDVAVDTSTDHVYVANGSQITEYDSAGSQISAFGQGELCCATGVAVDPTSGKVYVSDFNALRTYGPLVTLPDATTGPASNVQPDSATISGSVDPAGGPDASCAFEWGTNASYGQTVPCDPTGPFDAFQAVTAQLSSLTAGVEYHYRLVSTSASGTSFGQDQSFTTLAMPKIVRTYASDVTTTGAEISAVIEGPPGTTYHFEYGPADCTSNPCTSIPVIESSVPSAPAATQSLSGLTPGSTYHYRVVATSPAGTLPGPDRYFRTFDIPDPDQGLVDGRAYEMVSPPDKNGGGIAANPWRTRSSISGDRVSFSSLNGFGDVAGSSPNGAEYLAQRGPDGWRTHGITPLGTAPASPGQIWARYTEMTPDLEQGVFVSSPRSPVVAGHPNVAEVTNFYLRTDLSKAGSGTWQLLSDSVDPLPSEEVSEPATGIAYAGANRGTDSVPPFSRVLFDSNDNLTGETSGTSPKAYEWDDGTLRVASVLPDDACASPPCYPEGEAAVAGRGASKEKGEEYTKLNDGYTENSISADGSRVFFTVGPLVEAGILADNMGNGLFGSGVYMREDHSETVKLNESERTVPDAPQPAQWAGSNVDGSRTFLLTAEKLTDDDSNDVIDLYMYEVEQPAGSRLTLLSNPIEVHGNAAVSGVSGISDDGEYVYFVSSNMSKFVPGKPTAEASGRSLYVWHDGVVRFVGGSEASDWSQFDGSWLTFNGIDGAKGVRVSPDGLNAAFWTYGDPADLTGYDRLPAATSKNGCDGVGTLACVQVFHYSYADDELSCASCPSTNAVPSGPSTPMLQDRSTKGLLINITTQYLNRAMSADGSRVFFTSRNRLVPEDTNGRYDVYQYDVASGKAGLISTGQCFCDSYFAEASPSGDDVFFTTRERLVAIDTDNAIDLYDARVDGGIAAQNAPPAFECQGDACQGPPTAPNDPTPASSSFHGAGNQSERKAQRQKQRKKQVRKKRKKRSAQKAHRHHRPDASRREG